MKEKLSIGGKINFHKGNAAPAAGALPKAAVFVRCVQSAISFMKWSKTQGKIAMDGNFRKRKAWMPFVSAPAGFTAFVHFINEI